MRQGYREMVSGRSGKLGRRRPLKRCRPLKRYDPQKMDCATVTGTRGGFTLVEVLVVLSILVLLFAMLFAPMMVGLDMVTDGRVRTNMQDALRMTMEQIRRDVSDGAYVYPTPTIRLAGANGTLGDGDDEAVTDYSQIVFVKAERDGEGKLQTPVRPAMHQWDDGGVTRYDMAAIRYLVKLVDTTLPWNDANSFALYRQEGIYVWDDAEQKYVFGRRDSVGTFEPGVTDKENVMTPKTGVDIPPTSTVCTACGAASVGYMNECPAACGGTVDDLVYLHSGVKFSPERIEGDTLSASEHNTLYAAQRGNWMGFGNNGTIFLPGTALSNLESQMQPRIVLQRYDDATSSYGGIALDSYSATRSGVNVRWNAADGTVRLGDYETVRVSVAAADLTALPSRGGNNFFQLTVTDQGDPANTDDYDSSGALAGGRLASVVPIYGALPSAWQDPLMPIAFAVYPDDADGTASSVTAKVVPDSVYVRITAVQTDGTVRRAEYSLTETTDQEQIGEFQFAQYQAPNDRQCEVRFNRWSPPSPEAFGSLSEYYIDIIYYYRRNFDATTNRDDIMVVDYSTAELLNVSLKLNQFADPEPYKTGEIALVVPSDLRISEVTLQSQIEVRNIR